MDRYSKYFLQHILYLDDGFNKYYVQDKAWGRQEILDVESVIFDWDDDAEQWLSQCADYDRTDTISHLRSFLANDCAELYQVHRMSDRQVMHAVARQMTQGLYQIVIKPRLGWAVQVDAATATPALPLRVEPEPDLDELLSGLKKDLNDLVAEQQKQYDQYEVRMRGMNAAQKALFVKQQMDGAAYDTAIGDNLELIKAAPGAIWSAAKAFPGFYKGYLKFLWKVAQLPSKMAGLAAQAVATGDINPLKAEIDKIVTPVASTYEEAMEYKSMLTILCSEPEVYELLYDFAERYYEATHPIELAKMGTSAVTEVLITVLLAIFTAGTGAAANMAAKSGKLVKVFKLLKKITKTIKKISPSPKLLDRSKNAAKKTKKTRKAAAKRAKGMPEVDTPKKTKGLEKTGKKKYNNIKADLEGGSVPNTNPGFPEPGRTQNCVNCSIATDHTFAGNPASALPSKRPQPLSVMEKHFGGKFKPIANRTAIEKKMAPLGPGSRGIVAGVRSKGPGHVFNVVVDKKGVVKFFDGQSMKPASFEGYSEFRLLVTNKP